MKKTPIIGLAALLALPLLANADQVTKTSQLPIAAQASISAALGRDMKEYHARSADGRISATNPRQKFEARFATNNVEVQHGIESWSISLRGVGYGDTISKVDSTAPQADVNRVEYHHASVTEWYVNGPLGLEQGFTLNQAPGKSNGKPLTIALTLSGDLNAVLDASRNTVMLTDRSKQPVLRYTGLRAYDAAGKELTASLELNGHQLRLKVNDADARYPVTVDPVTQEAVLTASNGQSGDQLGFSVAMNGAGNTVVLGAPNATPSGGSGPLNTGVVYVFYSPGGWQNMTETAQLSASDGARGDQFGASVAINGTTIVVGAPLAAISTGSGSNGWQGAAYVFVGGSNGAWSNASQVKLIASDGNSSDQFGYSVAVSGNTAIVGAPFAAVNNNYAQGAAYVYVEPSGGWTNGPLTQTSKFTTSTGTVWDNFGKSVAISASTAVVGSPYSELAANQLRGAAFVFIQPNGGWPTTMTPSARLLASDGATGDEFGYVAISGDTSTIVVGAPWNVPTGGAQQGAAYVFVRPSGGWTNMVQTAKLTATDGHRPDYFGNSVAISDDHSVIAVGAPNYTASKTIVSEGAAYVFWEPSGGWVNASESASAFASGNNLTNYFFGTGVAISDNSGTATMVSGTPGDPASAGYASGAGIVFSVTQ